MDKRGKGEKAYPERDFSYLNDKSPVELIAEMEEMISNMSDENFDHELVEAYLAVLKDKTPGIDDFDPEASFERFLDQHADVLAQPLAAKAQQTPPKRSFRSRFVYVAATVLVVLFVGTVTANAYGINVFDVIVQWGEEVFQLRRGELEAPSGKMELPEGSDAEYTSLEDALEKNGLSAKVCPTWVPERYQLSMIEVQEDSGEIGLCALYKDQEGNTLVCTIDYAPGSQAIHYIEKDPGSEQVYYDHGVEYYLVTNAGDWVANWMDENSSYLISGAISEEELKHMLSSIYER